jgi:endoglucanase
MSDRVRPMLETTPGRITWSATPALLAAALGVAACGRETIVAVTKIDGTITEHDAAPVRPDHEAPPGPGFHTEGPAILNEANQPVHFRGVSWFGLETTDYAPHGLWARPMSVLLDQIRSLGFNTLRIPWSSELLDPGSVPKGFDPSTYNPDLAGLTGPEIMDKLVAGAAARGLYVILDHHRASAGSAGRLWKDDAYDDARFIEDWKNMAARYLGVPAVVACDLHTDLRNPATWGDGNPDTDWRAAAERAGNAVLGVNPRLLVIVEGVEQAGGGTYWRGGNLHGARTQPVELVYSHKVVYGTQDFPESVGDQPPGGVPWLTDPKFPANLPDVWNANWGYLVTSNTAPVVVAAFGTELMSDKDKQWLAAFTGYLGTHDIGFVYWALNPNSTYTGGVLTPDWLGPRADLMAALAPILSAP